MNWQSSLKHQDILDKAARYIAGGVVSLNRKVNPNLIFTRANGSKMYDTSDTEYIDYHAAFSPYFLGHNFDLVNAAVIQSLKDNQSLIGSGTTSWESRLAEMLCELIPSFELVQITNTGSEATAHAIRLSRAYTQREDIVLILGGYNGWHNEVARLVMPSLQQIGPRRSLEEYDFIPLSAGIPEATKRKVHIINFNDLDSLEFVLKKYEVACVLTEPVLQNIGVVKPKQTYLEGMVRLCREYGAVSIFDEVKTGFRSSISGYQGICGVYPDLSVFGKAIANGYPLGAIGGKREIMSLFDDPNPDRRVLIAGTYNAHPINTSAAIATLDFLKQPNVYLHVEKLYTQLYEGLRSIFAQKGKEFVLCNNASAFCLYFMPTEPTDLHDILNQHDFDFDMRLRHSLIREGIYHIPLPCKQGSVSYSHTTQDIEITLEKTQKVVKGL